jgi:hypothetical protein
MPLVLVLLGTSLLMAGARPGCEHAHFSGPEPGTIALLVLGGIGWLLWRTREARAKRGEDRRKNARPRDRALPPATAWGEDEP